MPIAKKLFFTSVVMTIFFLIEMLALFFVIKTLSSARAYVSAESLWSKAQKDGLYNLEKYGRTRDEAYFKRFVRNMTVPLGDKQAREELIKKDPDLNIVRQGFLIGKNNWDDIEGMITTYSRFHSIDFTQKIISKWEKTDKEINKIIPFSATLHREINSANPSKVKIENLLMQLEPLNEKLTKLEVDFSDHINNGSRWLENLILIVLIVLAIILVTTKLLITVSVTRGIYKGINEIIRTSKKIAQGDFSSRAIAYSTDEIGLLAHSFNHMTNELEHNINERKLVEGKIRESERALAEAQRLAHIGNWEWDIDTDKITWSDELYRIYGLHHHEFDGKYQTFLECIHPEDKDYVKHIIETADKQKRGINYIHRIIRQNDGAVRIVNGRGRAVIEKGRVVKFIGTAQDITEAEQAEEKIRNSSKALAEAQHIAHIGSWEWNVNTNEVSWSDELYELYGVNKEDFKASYEGFLECVYPEDRDYVDKLIRDAGMKKKPLDYFHRIIRKNDHKVRMLQCYGRTVLDENGDLVKITGTAQDVTEAKQSEDRIKQLSLIASESTNGILILNRDGKVEWVNDGFTRLSGYTLKDLAGTTSELLRNGEDTGHKPGSVPYETLMREKKPVIYEAENYTKDGRKYWAQTTLSPLLDEHGEIYKIIAIDSDISRLKQTEEELIAAKEKAEQSRKVKEEFLANMSHEIRTPMNGIIGFARLLEDSPLTPAQKEYLGAIKTSGSNLLVIINEILDFSKLEAGKIVFEEVKIDLLQCVDSVIQMLQTKILKNKVILSQKMDPRIPQILLGDQVRLSQVLINLISNAIKFTEKGTIKVITQLLEEDEDCAEIEFRVQDTGIGIPAEKLDLIFESFSQASSNTTRKYGGTGLGLTITKKLVELQNGTIKVESEVNKGSTFIFTLRFKKHKNSECEDDNCQNSDKQESESESTKTELKSLSEIKILLVEDNTLNQLLATKVLQTWNTTPDIASNGKIAIEKLKDNSYDLVLMDIQMPEMDGYETTRYIRSNISTKLPIIAMTANAMVGEKEKCLEAGLNDCISKPFDLDDLYAKIIQYTQFTHAV
ncbi:MAG: luxQ 1 [Bacteroidetes bacterium]|nr:luxQ 1 [Bacteroidota bacterium]